jgi:hypothetical protein
MKLPKPFTGWVTPKGKAHVTQEAAMADCVREEMFRVLYDHVNARESMSYRVTPEAAVDLILQHFNVSPKVVTE